MSVFDINERIERIKARPDAGRIGMILRAPGHRAGRVGAGDPVHGMLLHVDRRRFDEALAEARTWAGRHRGGRVGERGRSGVGDDIMKVVVAGDIRENVFGALQRLVGSSRRKW